MSIKYITIFPSKAPEIYPNWDFGFENKPSGNPGPTGENSPNLITLIQISNESKFKLITRAQEF
jgi:hypothetical protein